MYQKTESYGNLLPPNPKPELMAHRQGCSRLSLDFYQAASIPSIWLPIPGVQTLNFRSLPRRPHALRRHARRRKSTHHRHERLQRQRLPYAATASLAVSRSRFNPGATGAVAQNALTAPSPSITEKLDVSKNGDVSGTVNTASTHNFTVSGYVNTSAGAVTTTLAQNINFSNLQKFTINANSYVQDITQGTNIDSTTTVVDSNGTLINDVNTQWPMSMDILLLNADGSGTQTATVNQNYAVQAEGKLNGNVVSFSVLNNSVTPTDALGLIEVSRSPGTRINRARKIITTTISAAIATVSR